MVLEMTVLAAVMAVVALIFIYSEITGSPPVPTAPATKAVMLSMVPADLEGSIHELGSGWGTMAFALARRHPRCPVTAFELSPVPWLFSRLRLALGRYPNLTLRRQDFHRVHLGGTALVVCYLQPRGMRKLKPKLEAELDPGTLVLSNTFAFDGWRAQEERRVADIYSTRVYLYRAPG